jgi:O-antigen/teichoic acid export membrane protein
MKLTMFAVVPLAFGMLAVARNMILVLLTEKWLGCVLFLQVYCLGYMLLTMVQPSLQVYRALGDSTTPLVMEIIKKVSEILLLVAAIAISVEAVAYASLLTGIIGLCLTMIFARVKLKYRFNDQIKDILAPILLGVAMVGGVYLVDLLPLSALATLILQVLAGVVIYVGGALLFRIEAVRMLLTLIRKRGTKPDGEEKEEKVEEA